MTDQESITTRIRINVPSGRLIVDDDLRSAYKIDDDGFASYNTKRGQAQVIEAMATAGCAYGPVGNTCPGFWLMEDGSYTVANGIYGETADDETLPGGVKCLAGVCTDLWAYSIADAEDWRSRGGDPDNLHWTQTIVEVPPGVYEFTHHTGESDFDRDAEPAIYAHIRRVADPEPVRH
jgi:hypothetical protein